MADILPEITSVHGLYLDYVKTGPVTCMVHVLPGGGRYLHVTYTNVNETDVYIQKYKPANLVIDVNNPWQLTYGEITWPMLIIYNVPTRTRAVSSETERVVQAQSYADARGPHVTVVELSTELAIFTRTVVAIMMKELEAHRPLDEILASAGGITYEGYHSYSASPVLPPVTLGDSLVPSGARAEATRLGVLFREATFSGTGNAAEHYGRVCLVHVPRTGAGYETGRKLLEEKLPSGTPLLLLGGAPLDAVVPPDAHVVYLRNGHLAASHRTYNLDADEPSLDKVVAFCKALGTSVEAFTTDEIRKHLTAQLADGRPEFASAASAPEPLNRKDNVAPSPATSLVLPSSALLPLQPAADSSTSAVLPAQAPSVASSTDKPIVSPSLPVHAPPAAQPDDSTATSPAGDTVNLTVLHPDNCTKMVCGFQNGLRHGICSRFYASGAQRDIRNYKRGRLHGPYICHDAAGRISVMGEFQGGQRHGKWTFMQNGAPTHTVVYDLGRVL